MVMPLYEGAMVQKQTLVHYGGPQCQSWFFLEGTDCETMTWFLVESSLEHRCLPRSAGD